MRISALEPKVSPNWQGRQGSHHWDLGKKFEFFLKYSRCPCLSSTVPGTWLPPNKYLLNGDSINEIGFLTLTSHPPKWDLVHVSEVPKERRRQNKTSEWGTVTSGTNTNHWEGRINSPGATRRIIRPSLREGIHIYWNLLSMTLLNVTSVNSFNSHSNYDKYPYIPDMELRLKEFMQCHCQDLKPGSSASNHLIFPLHQRKVMDLGQSTQEAKQLKAGLTISGINNG